MFTTPASGMTSPQKTALVSGASSGIGLATARLLLEKGYRVTGLSRRGQVAALDHPDFNAVSIDLSELEASDREVRRLLKEFQYDCLVHAAGQGLFGSIEQFSLAQIDASIRINLTSALVLSRALLPGFRRRGSGRIIFIGSESALVAGRKGSLYSAAKFGLRGFSQALRNDCAGDGIQVSLVNPGMVRSPFFDELSFRPGANPENAIEVDEVAAQIFHILQSSDNAVIDEINLSPRVKSIDFSPAS